MRCKQNEQTVGGLNEINVDNEIKANWSIARRSLHFSRNLTPSNFHLWEMVRRRVSGSGR